jgi:hypothetical protein
MTKIVIVHPGLYTPANEALTGSFAPDVVAIKYNEGMTKEDVLGAVDGPVSSIAFMYHYPGYNSVPFFPDIRNIPDIDSAHVIPTYQNFSNKLIDIIKAFRDRISNGEQFIVDLLTCDLNSQSFKDEVMKIEGDFGVDIRYSVDKTGNPASGANWILESDGVNVQSLYFTNEVLGWNGLLATDITASIKAGTYAAYITWNAGTSTFTVQQNFLWSALGLADTDSYIALGAGETFDGNNKTINITGYNFWRGLFSTGGTSLATGPTIKNLGILNGNISTFGGFFIRREQSYFKVQQCYSTGNITNNYAGGISGYWSGKNGSCTITNCYSTGNLVGSGGIVGENAGTNGYCLVTNCYSTGNALGIYTGGIAGFYAGQQGRCDISNCYSTGSIGDSGGGIIGPAGADTNGIVTITNCYSTGTIGSSGGGIAGERAATNSGSVTITNCYSTGSIGSNGGGITGDYTATLSGSVTLIQSICNGTPYYGPNSNIEGITTTTLSSTLTSIDNTLYSGWSSSVWVTASSTYLTYKLPILLAFQASPWSASSYTIPTSAASFIIPLAYTYTILVNGTASFTGTSGGSVTGNIKLLYISGSTSAGTLSNIPSSGSYQITQIGDSALSGQTGITGFSTPFASTFGASAFSGCSALAYLYVGIPSGVPTFGSGCFDGCTALTSNVFKNVNNTSWTTDPSPSGTGLNTYTPLSITLTTALTSATLVSITPSTATGGTASKAPVPPLSTVYNYYINGTQTQIDIASPIAQEIAPTDTYYLTAGNIFETNSAIGTGMSEGITKYLYGARAKIMNIGM